MSERVIVHRLIFKSNIIINNTLPKLETNGC